VTAVDEKLLAQYEAALARAIESPEGAKGMFEALAKKHKEPARLLAKAREVLQANGVDPDTEPVEPPKAEPEPPTAPAVREAEPITSAGRPPRFWVPDAVFDQGLTAIEFKVYAYLCRRAGKSRVAWPKLSTMARECGMYRETVSAAVSGLLRLNMLTRRRRDFGKPNLYRLLPPDEWKRPVSGSQPPTAAGSSERLRAANWETASERL
jgi:Helix-turn-helix domain